MTIVIGNAPCSWGVEFPDDLRNPAWAQVLDECRRGWLSRHRTRSDRIHARGPGHARGCAFAARDLTLIGGVVFRPFHDGSKWDEVKDAVIRTCRSLTAHGASHLVLINSISPRRAPTAGRPDEAEQMEAAEWRGFVGRLRDVARIGAEDYGLTVSIHPHAAGFIDFEPEVERLLETIEREAPEDLPRYRTLALCRLRSRRLLESPYRSRRLCPLQGHRPEGPREGRRGAHWILRRLRAGRVLQSRRRDDGFPRRPPAALDHGYDGWCTVEQDCDPAGPTSPVADARANRDYLASIGFN